MIKLGNINLSECYVGDTGIASIYVGDSKIWPNTPEPEPSIPTIGDTIQLHRIYTMDDLNENDLYSISKYQLSNTRIFSIVKHLDGTGWVSLNMGGSVSQGNSKYLLGDLDRSEYRYIFFKVKKVDGGFYLTDAETGNVLTKMEFSTWIRMLPDKEPFIFDGLSPYYNPKITDTSTEKGYKYLAPSVVELRIEDPDDSTYKEDARYFYKITKVN